MKKMMRLFPAIVSILFIASGCGNGSMSNANPKEVLAEFFQRLGKKDIDGAAKLATKDSKGTMDMMKKGMEMAEKMKDLKTETKEEDMAEEFKNVEMGDAKIDGDMATVPFKNVKKNVEFDFPLKKEDGAWKVDFSFATLMKMGMNEMNKQKTMGDEEGGDSMDMKDFDPEKMKEGLKMADSMLKKIDPEKLKDLQESMKKLQEANK